MDRKPISIPEFDGLVESGFPNNDVVFFTEQNETGKTGFGVHFFANNKYQQCLTGGLYKYKRNPLETIN
ncbi:hypothetical protein LI82_10830 [Methanococcoides methylutens]|uniref:Uncharacterized protein n=1 Tax=Methanococcoides methylutens TaxID=2226 RepID=A0A099T1U4_METMT|nr:hypothetical protein [Methanococcoides methylutens]KGK98206.1 hypothetical protein LI82_10830 [Methanococcoides methylutens]